MSACVNLPLYHKVQKFSSGTGSPGSSQKKGRKAVVCVCVTASVASQSECWSTACCEEIAMSEPLGKVLG